jgi:hypothetical protein
VEDALYDDIVDPFCNPAALIEVVQRLRKTSWSQ